MRNEIREPPEQPLLTIVLFISKIQPHCEKPLRQGVGQLPEQRRLAHSSTARHKKDPSALEQMLSERRQHVPATEEEIKVVYGLSRNVRVDGIWHGLPVYLR